MGRKNKGFSSSVAYGKKGAAAACFFGRGNPCSNFLRREASSSPPFRPGRRRQIFEATLEEGQNGKNTTPGNVFHLSLPGRHGVAMGSLFTPVQGIPTFVAKGQSKKKDVFGSSCFPPRAGCVDWYRPLSLKERERPTAQEMERKVIVCWCCSSSSSFALFALVSPSGNAGSFDSQENPTDRPAMD